MDLVNKKKKKEAMVLIIQEMQIKTTMRYHLISMRRTTSKRKKKKKDISVDERPEKKGNPRAPLMGMQTGTTTLKISVELLLKIKNRIII